MAGVALHEEKMMMQQNRNRALTCGVHHIGLTVPDIGRTRHFFVETLGYRKVGEAAEYPAVFLTDGTTMITLWRTVNPAAAIAFDRKNVIGLHHLALSVEAGDLDGLHERLLGIADVSIEFAPEPLRGLPARHMMCTIPGGIRIEFLAPDDGKSGMTHDVASPFHAGERELQQRAGVRDRVERAGRRFVRDYLPDEHRQFYPQLRSLFVGSVDSSVRPWASILFGRPGWLSSPDPHHLVVKGRPVFGDPLQRNLTPDAQVGLLGIDFSTRRRNRVNGTVSHVESGCFRVAVAQTFGNCPQYIQAREQVLVAGTERVDEPRPVQEFRRFDARARDVISRSDTFFIATTLAGDVSGGRTGTDVSHRGGRPGFVRIDADDILTVPDFPGNRYFNTLGNILLNPRAGLLFIDFRNGDLLSLTGTAEIIWDGPEVRAFGGAERLVRFSLDEGILIDRVVPNHWRFLAWSPSLDRTGSWEEARSRLDTVESKRKHLDYVVTRGRREGKESTILRQSPLARYLP